MEENEILTQPKEGEWILEGKLAETVETDVLENKEEIVDEKVEDKPVELDEKIEEKPDEKVDEKPEEVVDEIKNPFELETSTPAFKYSELGKELELDLPDSATKDELISAYKQKIEDAKQKVEPDISKFDPEAQILFNHISNGGSVTDFIEPLKPFYEFSALTPQEKVEVYLTQVAQMTEADAKEKVQTMIDDEDKRFDGYLQEVNNMVERNKQATINGIVQQHEQRISQIRTKAEAQAKQEREALKSVVSSTTMFDGIPIPEGTRQEIIRDIDSGSYDKVLNSPKAQHEVYLRTRFAKQIADYHEKRLKDAKREGFNEADRKANEKLHNHKPIIDSSVSHNVKSKTAKTGLDKENFEQFDL